MPPRRGRRIAWDAAMALLAILSVALVFWIEVDAGVVESYRMLLWLDLVVVGLFAADWAWGFAKAPSRKRFFWRNVWELPGLVPLLFVQFGALRLFRLFRLVRLLRAVRGVRRLVVDTRRLGIGSQVAQLALASSMITLAGSLLVWVVERGSNPSMETYREALWWAVVTVTTVGYGDITPITNIGRGIAVLLMVTGIGTIGLLASQVGSSLVMRAEETIGEEAVAAAAPESVAGQLSALAVLHDKGKISEAEYEAAKQRVLWP